MDLQAFSIIFVDVGLQTVAYSYTLDAQRTDCSLCYTSSDIMQFYDTTSLIAEQSKVVISGVVTLSDAVLYHRHCFFIFDDGVQKTVCHETSTDFD